MAKTTKKKPEDKYQACPSCGRPMCMSLEFSVIRGRLNANGVPFAEDYGKVACTIHCSDFRCGYRDRTAAETRDQETMLGMEDIGKMFHADNLLNYGKWEFPSKKGGRSGRRITILSQTAIIAEKIKGGRG